MTLTEKNVSDLLERHLDRQSAHTKRAYRGDIAAFQQWCRAETPGAALCKLLRGGRTSANRLVTKLESNIVKVMARSTVRRRLSALKSFVRAAFREGFVDWHLEVLPTKDLTTETKKATGKRNMSGPDKPTFRRIVIRMEAELVLPGKRIQAARDLAILALLSNPMLRLSEVAQLDLEDLRSLEGDNPSVRFIGKGRMSVEELPLAPSTVSALRRWLKIRKARPSAPLFVRVRKATGDENGPHLTNERLSSPGIYKIMIQRGAAVLKKRRLNPHSLRHHGITRLVEYAQKNDISFQEATKLSRHKKVETLMQYVDGMDKRVRQMARGIDSG